MKQSNLTQCEGLEDYITFPHNIILSKVMCTMPLMRSVVALSPPVVLVFLDGPTDSARLLNPADMQPDNVARFLGFWVTGAIFMGICAK